MLLITEPVVYSVNESDVTLEQSIAKGSEGEVWRGQLRGHGLASSRLSWMVIPRLVQALWQSNWPQVWRQLGKKGTQSGERARFQVNDNVCLLCASLTWMQR